MRKLTLALVFPYLLVACGPSESGPVPPATPSIRASTSAINPTPAIGPFGARIHFCKHLAAFAQTAQQPVKTLRGPADARPLEGWAATFLGDAQVLAQAGNPTLAAQITGYADALSKLAQDIRRPPPANKQAADKWNRRTAVRRRQLLEGISTELNPLLAVCERWILGR